jgi:aspartate/methionine/tyrosine aminotransferase
MNQKQIAMSDFQAFEMERYMSVYEMAVKYNMSESGVHPMLLRELLALEEGSLEKMLEVELNYSHANGNPELRENIAAMYDGASKENVLVTVGGIEANFNALTTILSAGDEMVLMLPNYMQVWGVAKNHGINIKTFSLLQEKNWAPDLDKLESIVSNETKLIAICNPNNPTGYILTEAEVEAIVKIADRVGAWILADEVYAGAEQLTDVQTPSFFGRYEKVIAVGSMSKAYGLPGLRTGWAVGPVDMIDQIWARHEYTTLSAAMLSNTLAALALSEKVRPTIIARTRDYIRKGYPVLTEWMQSHGDLFSAVQPQAAAIAFVRYKMDINSTEFVMRLLKEKSVLIIPGDHFGMDRYLRISYGLPKDYLLGGLQGISELIAEL